MNVHPRSTSGTSRRLFSRAVLTLAAVLGASALALGGAAAAPVDPVAVEVTELLEVPVPEVPSVEAAGTEGAEGEPEPTSAPLSGGAELPEVEEPVESEPSESAPDSSTPGDGASVEAPDVEASEAAGGVDGTPPAETEETPTVGGDPETSPGEESPLPTDAVLEAPAAEAFTPLGTIRGSVVPPAGASADWSVSLQLMENDQALWEAATVTAADPTFEVSVEAGTWRILASGSFVDQWWNNASLASATPIVVAPGQVVSEIDFQMAMGGRISGTVTDEHGDGVGGITVSAMNDGGWSFDGTTGPDGTYTINGLEAGNYYVSFAVPGHETSGSIGPVSVGAGGLATGVDHVTTRGVTVSGVVLGTDGSPLSGTWVSIHANTDTFTQYAARTGPDGRYTFYDVAPGEHILWFTPPPGKGLRQYWGGSLTAEGATPLVVGDTDVVADVQIVAGSRIVGTYSGSTKELQVRVFAESGEQAYSGSGRRGTWQVSDLLPGTYLLEFSASDSHPQFYDATTDRSSAMRVTIGLNGIETVDLGNIAMQLLNPTPTPEESGTPTPSTDPTTPVASATPSGSSSTGAVRPTRSSSGSLASTGADAGSAGLTALVLFAGGAAVIAAARRRRMGVLTEPVERE